VARNQAGSFHADNALRCWADLIIDSTAVTSAQFPATFPIDSKPLAVLPINLSKQPCSNYLTPRRGQQHDACAGQKQ
jgi:hypothetical protein